VAPTLPLLSRSVRPPAGTLLNPEAWAPGLAPLADSPGLFLLCLLSRSVCPPSPPLSGLAELNSVLSSVLFKVSVSSFSVDDKYAGMNYDSSTSSSISSMSSAFG